MKSIGALNLLRLMEKQKEDNQQLMREIVKEVSLEVERLKIQLDSLQKTERQQSYAVPHDLEKYRVKTATSTPTKDGDKVDPNFSTISEVEQPSMCQRTRIDETVGAKSPIKKRRKAEDLVELISMKKVMGAGHFLDGCSIFMVGFSPTRRDKLNKIINMSGATRYDDFSDSVTHVIVGNSIELSKIKENFAGGCHLVTLQWLLDSVDEQKPAQENNYRVLDLETTDGNLTQEVVNLFTEEKTTDVENEDALTQKYLKTIENVEVEDTLAKMLENQSEIFKMHSFQPQNTSTQISQATTDLSESSMQINIFEGLKFTLQDFDKESYQENKNLIKSVGGIISNNNCDYAIVPIIYNSKEFSATKIVNELWLHENIQTGTLISDLQYYHQPFTAPTTSFLSGCVITLSVYANYEREFLKSLIVGFGGIFQEQFTRKTNEAKNLIASTHLIIPEASGKKYEAALKWNLPVITKDWLLACVKANKKLPYKNYSLDDDTLTSEHENPKTPTSNFKPSSQVTPINKILQDAINCKVLPTPPSPKQYFPWDPKTPDTPLGWFIRPNPSPALRKEMQKYVNSFPDFVPPKRRDSTPLSELKKRLLDKASLETNINFLLGRGEYSETSKTNDEIEAQKLLPQRLSFEDNNKPTEDNTSLHQKLQNLQKMVQGSANNTPRRSTWIEASSSEPLGNENIQSQVCTVNWDYEEEKIQNPSKKFFLLSGINQTEKLTGWIKSLGAQYSNAREHISTATHLICLKPGRNEKTLCFMAAGKWILHMSYLEKSAEAGHFLDEEEFEFGNPKAKKNGIYEEKDNCIFYWRKEIKTRGYGAFNDMRAIIIAEKKELLANVVQSGGGAVVNVEPPFNDSIHATHCLMEIKSVDDFSQFVPLVKQGIKCVNTIYVNDFLWKKFQNDLDCIVPYFAKYYK
ncbi:unnamed protein product [Ceutorhynchus assimilis]|uniref:BRCT domain-containing protein n=1 Tax=Ceutorhynchus assimilis TaxID=467358 RepID=A0A9N9MI67_9CUCU|nr:unnamed protein product [Ceutorhynchus assimilis]